MPGFSKSILAKRVQGSTLAIADDAGNELSGVTITTSANANISLTHNAGTNITYLLPQGQQVITATKAGYVTNKTAVDISGVVHITIVLANTTNLQSTQTITDADSTAQTVTNTARASNNATVDFPAGAIVDSNGNPVSNVTVQVTNVSISDTGSVDIFPGLFVGNDAGTITPIESYGFMNVTLTNTATGEELTLDPAKGATVRLPVDPDPELDIIPTYRLDESTGQWTLLDYAYRITGSNVFEFRVTTFSWVNLDVVPWDQYYPFECTVLANPDDDSTALPEDDSTVGNVGSVPGQSTVAGVRVYVNKPYASPLFRGQCVTNAQGIGTIAAVPGGQLFIYGIKGTTYYTASYSNFDGTTIIVYLRPNGSVQVPTPSVTTTTDKQIVYADEQVAIDVTVGGAEDDNFADYLITGVDSSDIDGASLTGRIDLTTQNPFTQPDIPQIRVRRGRLYLNMIRNISGYNKTMIVTFTTSGGLVISRTVTLRDMSTDSMKSGLTVVGLGVDGTSYIIGNGENGDIGPSHKVKITLATRHLANQSIPYTITGVTSSDISGASLTGNFTVVNGNPTATQSLSSFEFTVDPNLTGLMITLILTVTFADASTNSTYIYLTPPDPGAGGLPPP